MVLWIIIVVTAVGISATAEVSEMNVICKSCGGLEKEEDAIRMNLMEYRTWEQLQAEKPGIIHISLFEENLHTQICRKCYAGKTSNKPDSGASLSQECKCSECSEWHICPRVMRL